MQSNNNIIKEESTIDVDLLNFTSVISLNDLINWEKDSLWLETIGGDLTQLTKNQIAMLIFLGAVWGSDNYGKTWRCWTAKPTDKQRKAVKWK